MKMLLLASLRGNIFLYYGEELGLPQVDVPFEDLQDPEAIANWPQHLVARRRAHADAVAG
jgi:alpha-glucosidase